MTDPVQTFVRAEASDPDSAWKAAVSKTITAPAPSANVQERKSRFKDFSRKFLSHSKQPDFRRLGARSKYTIEDVQIEANAAIDAYELQGTSFRSHFVRTSGRSLSNNASIVEGLLGFLPSGDYGSVLCMALTLVFNGAKRLSSTREKVLTTLNSLLYVVDGTKELMKLYTGDFKLWELAEQLYIGLLDTTESMLLWLDQSAFRHAIGATFKQDNYAKPLDDLQSALSDKIKAFHVHLEYCQHERINKIYVTQEKMLAGAQDISDEQKTLTKLGEQQSQQLVELLDGLARDRKWHEQARESDRVFYIDLLNKLASQPPTIMAYRAGSYMTTDQLQNVLLGDAMTPGQDVDRALASTSSPGAQPRAAMIVRNSCFQDWFRSGSSGVFVINGEDPGSEWDSISATTLFAALLSKSLGENQVAVPLTFFCGQHASPSDRLEGVGGLLSSLCFQLLDHFRDLLDLSFLDFAFTKALEARETHVFCELFQRLIQGVLGVGRQTAIVCLIDGVTFLETEARVADFQLAVQTFQQVVSFLDGLRGLIILKVVLLYPTSSSYAWQWFAADSILTLDEEVIDDELSYSMTGSSDMAHSSLMLSASR